MPRAMAVGIGGAYASVLGGIQRGNERAMAAGEALTRDVDPEAIVELKLAETQVKASVKVAKHIDEMLGTLIDEIG